MWTLTPRPVKVADLARRFGFSGSSDGFPVYQMVFGEMPGACPALQSANSFTSISAKIAWAQGKRSALA